MTTVACRKDGTVVKPGEKITDFRGDPWVYIGCEAPRHPGSSGRVYVRDDRRRSSLKYDQSAFYPSVFNLTLREIA